MRYPDLLSRIGYYERLLEQYSKDFPNLNKKSVIEGSISMILQAIRSLFETNPQKEKYEEFNKVIEYISNVANLTKEKYNIVYKEIKPSRSIELLYFAINKPELVADLIQNNMAFTIEPENMEKYLEFLGKVVKQSCGELSEVNKPKLTVKTVRFSEALVMQSKNTELTNAAVETSAELVGKENLVEVNGIESNAQGIKSSINKLK